MTNFTNEYGERVFMFVGVIVCIFAHKTECMCEGVRGRVCVWGGTCVWCASGRFDPALISQFYQSIQCFVHHVSSLSTITGNVSCDTVHLIKGGMSYNKLCVLHQGLFEECYSKSYF